MKMKRNKLVLRKDQRVLRDQRSSVLRVKVQVKDKIKSAATAVGGGGITKMRARGTCRQPTVIYLAVVPKQAPGALVKGLAFSRGAGEAANFIIACLACVSHCNTVHRNSASLRNVAPSCCLRPPRARMQNPS
jgi:hypothetical protein